MRLTTASALLPVSALLPAALAGGLLATAVQAQGTGSSKSTELVDELVHCAGLGADDARLECYDSLARPLLGLGGGKDGDGPASLHRFAGKGDWDSETLELQEPWRVTWQNQGSLLTVELRTPQGETLEIVGNQIGSGGGRSEVLEPGNYSLAVRGLGGWRVQVVAAAEN